MEIQYYKVLGEGYRTENNFQWVPGEWNEEPLAIRDGKSSGVGLYVFKHRPNWNYTRYLPDHVYRVVDVEDLCGEDDEKARFRRVKLSRLPVTLREILGQNRDGMLGLCLSGADLSGADLSRANLSRANLSEANLSEANLSGAHGCMQNAFLSDRQREQAHC